MEVSSSSGEAAVVSSGGVRGEESHMGSGIKRQWDLSGSGVTRESQRGIVLRASLSSAVVLIARSLVEVDGAVGLCGSTVMWAARSRR